MTLFENRQDAGRTLAVELEDLRLECPVVVGLPRGGVIVAHEVARALAAPLDVAIVDKISVPGQPQLVAGVVAEDGIVVFNDDVLAAMQLTRDELAEAVAVKEREVAKRRQPFAPFRSDLSGRTVILVDDGLATGMTALGAARVLRSRGARQLILAVPVCAWSSLEAIRGEFDQVIYVAAPDKFASVGEWYREFPKVSDDEVLSLLRGEQQAEGPQPAATERSSEHGPGVLPFRGGEIRKNTAARTERVKIPIGALEFDGELNVPRHSRGIALFAHGSGAGRLNPQNRFVARTLEHQGLTTLLFDLLTREEANDPANVFDVNLLGKRLLAATYWIQAMFSGERPLIGYFGAGTGAAAALYAAADLKGNICAVVSRGGRPDLAQDRLAAVTAPTLLIVGEEDRDVLELNREAAKLLRCEHEIEVIPGASHHFEEAGALEAVAYMAAEWFARWIDADVRLSLRRVNV